jgi:hypothetical protein
MLDILLGGVGFSETGKAVAAQTGSNLYATTKHSP